MSILSSHSATIFNLLFFIVYHAVSEKFGNETTKANYKWLVYKIFVDQENEILKTWIKDEPGKTLIMHTSHSDGHRLNEIMLNEFFRIKFENDLTRKGLNYTLTTDDLQKLIEKLERQDEKWPFQRREFDDSDYEKVHFDHSSYHSYSEICNFLDDLSFHYSEIVAVQTIGYSFQNQKIQTIQISDPLHSSSKRAIWIDGGTHGREWVSVTAALYTIDRLVKGYASLDKIAMQYVQNITWYITPVVNPDGYEYTRSSSDPQIRLWRKNRSGYCTGSTDKSCCIGVIKSCCIGVDLNRNYGYQWSDEKLKDDTCSNSYPGLAAFSEPETRAVSNFIRNRVDLLSGYISFHSYGQLWLYPYAYQENTVPPDVDSLKDLAIRAVDSIRNMDNSVYRYGTVPELLYVAPGGGHDWLKSIGVKYTYTVELRPDSTAFNGFIMSRDELIPTATEAWTGVRIVADQILQDAGFEKVIDDRNL